MDKDYQAASHCIRCRDHCKRPHLAMERCLRPNWYKIDTIAGKSSRSPAIRAEERREAAERRQQPFALPAPDQQEGDQGGAPRQAGLGDEAASDPTSLASSTTSSSGQAPMAEDDKTLEELLAEVNENKEYTEGVEAPLKREGEDVSEEVQSPRKMPRLDGPTPSGSASSSAMPSGEPQVRVVVAGELLEDGDLDLTFPDRPPELDPETLFKVESKAVETELMRLMEMGVLQHPGDQDLSGVETLSTKFVLDWRWRDEKWNRRARLVARGFAWLDPNRTDTFAPAGGQSLLRIIPALAQVRGWKLATVDVKDAYLMCPQPKHIKVTLDKKVAEALNIPRDWILGKVLPGQREGAAEWFQHFERHFA